MLDFDADGCCPPDNNSEFHEVVVVVVAFLATSSNWAAIRALDLRRLCKTIPTTANTSEKKTHAVNANDIEDITIIMFESPSGKMGTGVGEGVSGNLHANTS